MLNDLRKTGAADAIQLRALDLKRFEKMVGRLEAESVAEAAAGVSLVVEFEP